MTQIWKKWCRLCGKDNSQLDIFMKEENFSTLAETIQRVFSINIYTFDEAPTKVCKACHHFVREVINFNLRTHKVQEMFSDLQFNDKLDLIDIRMKYGVNSMQNNCVEYKSAVEIEKIFSSPKYDGNSSTENENIEILNNKIDDAATICDKESILSEEKKLECSTFKETRNSSKNNEDSIGVSKKNIKNTRNLNYIGTENATFSGEDFKKLQISHRKQKKHKRTHDIQQKNHNGKESVAECELCNKKFLNKGNYILHLKVKHSLITEPKTCKFCNKIFKAASSHRKHELTHIPLEERRTFPCLQCDKKFVSEESLNSHVKILHIHEKSFICEECGKGYVTFVALNSHKIVHCDEKSFKCPKCPKNFKRYRALKVHLESHENQKFICSICDTQLNTRILLRRHMAVHSDEKKHKCNFCERKFKRLDTFKNHLILHTGLKPYNCPFCELTFANGSNCRNHQKTSHPVELAAAEAEGVKQVCKNLPKIKQLRALNKRASSKKQDCELENSRR